MKRLLRAIIFLCSLRAVPPVIIGFFFLLYIGIAFFTDETLITLIAFTGKSFILAGVFALIPLNYAFQILHETLKALKWHRVWNGEISEHASELFDEYIELPAFSTFSELQNRFAAVGYKTSQSDHKLKAWRGYSLFPARILFLCAMLCLFFGILVSITSRTASRQMVVEGEVLPTPRGMGGRVDRITLANSTGPILGRTLTMDVAPSASGHGKRSFGLYPPALYGGYFVYPRYLGLAARLQFSAPDLATGYEEHCILKGYPPGKEDRIEISGSPYQIILSIPEPDAGTERYLSYMTGNVVFRFKLLKGKDVVFSGSVPSGGEFKQHGYRLALPDVRRLVVTDFIGDYGVLFIWLAILFFLVSVSIWLLFRVFCPRREILFLGNSEIIRAYSRAEGKSRKHAGIFHEALDLIDARQKPASE